MEQQSGASVPTQQKPPKGAPAAGGGLFSLGTAGGSLFAKMGAAARGMFGGAAAPAAGGIFGGAAAPATVASQRLLIRSASGNHQMDCQTLQFVPCAQSLTRAKLGSLNEGLLLVIVATFKQSPAIMHRIESTSRRLAQAVGTIATNDQLVWVPRHFTAPQDAVNHAARDGGTVVLSTGQYQGKLLLPPGVHVLGAPWWWNGGGGYFCGGTQ